MSTTISKGTVTKTETIGSGVIRNGNVVTLKYRGTLDSLTTGNDALPSKGANLTISGTRYVVTDVTITPGKGGLAEGIVTLKRSTVVSSQSTLDATFEVEMAQIEKSILTHPRYQAQADQVEKWMSSPPEFKNLTQYVDGIDATTGKATGHAVTGDMALECIAKIRKGIESYLVFAPVVTKTSYLTSIPANIGTNCGKRQSPEVASSAASAWLKTADRVTQSQDGSWTRIEQWTGADEWDTDLYGAAT